MSSLPRAGVRAGLIAGLFVMAAAALPAQEEAERIWAALRQGGYMVFVRHAIAPGGGDPPGFRLEDCSTQRNLSESGRRQARLIGEAFRSRDVPVGRVLSSQWCRCRQTAELFGLGQVEEYPVLNSFFADRSTAREQTEALRRFVSQAPPGENTILVTHQVNITELTGVWPASGELVIVRPDGRGGFALEGRLRPGG
ncbi:MAG: histidine phosphatase family protein [Spirochaetales bacterium]|nr:histidine phosphatase family protein [Spirochaetales bacterium]